MHFSVKGNGGRKKRETQVRLSFLRYNVYGCVRNLLQLDLAAGLLDLLLHSLGIVLGQGFLQGVGHALNGSLGLGQTQTGDLADDLDDLDLLGADFLQDYVELGLLFSSSSASASAVTMTELSIYSPIFAPFHALTKFCQ